MLQSLYIHIWAQSIICIYIYTHMCIYLCMYIYIYINTQWYTYRVEVMSSVTTSRSPCHRINKLFACKPQRLASGLTWFDQPRMRHFTATLSCYGIQSVFTLGALELSYFWENGQKDFTRKSSQSKWVKTHDVHIFFPPVFNETTWWNSVQVSARQLPGYQVWVSPVEAETTVRKVTWTARNTHQLRALRKHLVRNAISCSRALCNQD